MNTSPAARSALDRAGIDANRIAPGLYQGAYPPEGDAVRRAGFDVLVLCAVELQRPADRFAGVKVLHVPLDDSGRRMTGDEWSRANGAALAVSKLLDGGARVLVTCAAGRNRSGLVSALTLYLRTTASAAACVSRVQAARQAPSGPALSNRDFVAALTRLP